MIATTRSLFLNSSATAPGAGRRARTYRTVKWTECPLGIASFAFFDIETTGLRPDRGARITEIAVVGRDQVHFHWQRAGGSSSQLATQLPALFERLSSETVVGHNLRFDLRFVAYEAHRHGQEGPRLQFIDTLGLARRVLGQVQSGRLGALVEHFGIAPEGPLHTALVDARATRALFWKLVETGNLDTLADAGAKPLAWQPF